MADIDDFEEAKDSRFVHLLKPIRDLAENFNIDLAHELEEYLDQLEHTQFAFEGGNCVDFAEAALLIQGSTCVYSKKVEYLYNLVYQALDAVRSKKRQQDGGDDAGEGGAGARGAGARARAAAAAEEDEEEALARFWDPEPLMQEADDIDLDPVMGGDVGGSSHAFQRAPAILLALEDLAHVQGGMIGRQQQQAGAGSGTAAAVPAALVGGGGDGEAGCYRLQQCFVHCSGALLLDPRDGEKYDRQLRYVGGTRRALQAAPTRLTQQFQPLAPQQHQQGEVVAAAGAGPGDAYPLGHNGQQQPQQQGGQRQGGADEVDLHGLSQQGPGGSGSGASDDNGGDMHMAHAGVHGDDTAGGGYDHGGYDDDGGGGYNYYPPGINNDGEPDQDDMAAVAVVNGDGSGAMDVVQQQLGLQEGLDGSAAGPSGVQQEGADGQQGQQQQQTGAAAAPTPYVTRQRGRRGAGVVAAADGDDDDEGDEGGRGGRGRAYFDPYKPLDPHDKGNLPIKPMQVKRPSKAKVMATYRAMAAANASNADVGSISARRKGEAAIASAIGLVHSEFAYAAQLIQQTQQLAAATAAADAAAVPAAAKRASGRGKKAVATAAGRHAMQPVFDLEDAQAAEAAVEAEVAEAQQEAAAAAAAEEQLRAAALALQQQAAAAAAGGQGAPSGNGDVDDDNDGFGGAGADWGGLDNDLDDGGWGVGSGGEEGAGVAPRGLWTALEALGGGEGCVGGSGEEATYEELCRAHIESILAQAAAAEVQSDLARRVGAWRSRIEPLLAEEEARPGFDIQEYGGRILERLQGLRVDDGDTAPGAPGSSNGGNASDQPEKAFAAVGYGRTKYEVSRTFSAMLQLINNRNIAVCKGPTPDAPFTLRLLTTRLHHEAMGAQIAATAMNPIGHGAGGSGLTQAQGGTQAGGAQQQRRRGQGQGGSQRQAAAAAAGATSQGGEEGVDGDGINGDHDGNNDFDRDEENVGVPHRAAGKAQPAKRRRRAGGAAAPLTAANE